jgi:hypothetical protein
VGVATKAERAIASRVLSQAPRNTAGLKRDRSALLAGHLYVLVQRSFPKYEGQLLRWKVWDLDKIESVERDLFKENHLIPNDVRRDEMLNLCRSLELAKEAVARIVEGIQKWMKNSKPCKFHEERVARNKRRMCRCRNCTFPDT